MSCAKPVNINMPGLDAFLNQFELDQRSIFISAFVEEMDQRAKSLGQAVNDNDEERIRREAHGIKGTSATFQLLPLSLKATNVEQVKTNIVGLKKAATQLENEMKDVLVAVDALQLGTS